MSRARLLPAPDLQRTDRMHVEIWHNPSCGTSRNALALIRNAGIEPVIVDYLLAPPDKARLRQAIDAAGLSVRDAIRSKLPEFLAQGLDDATLSDDQLLDAMLATPILINRPFVFTPLGARLCRPDSSLVLDILPVCDKPFSKEDGEVVIDASGKRIR